MSQELILLRLQEAPARHAPVGVQCWRGDSWKSVQLDDAFSRAFDPDCTEMEPAENAIELSFEPGARALLLLPGSWVWSGLESIPKAVRRQSSAVGYMVEEQLAEDVEDLHFVCQAKRGDLCSVLAISREKMDALSSQIRRLQWPVISAVPDYQLLSVLESGREFETSVWIDGPRAHIWQACGRGLSVNRQVLGPVVEGLERENSAKNDSPGSVAVSADTTAEPHEPASAGKLLLLGELDELELASLENQVLDGIQVLAGVPEPQLLAHYQQSSLNNLLSGEYEIALDNGEGVWWHKPAIAVAACFVLQLVFFLAAGTYYKMRANSADTEVRELFAELFPGVRPQADLRRQINGYLNQSGGSGDGFARQLQVLSGVWGAGKAGELRLQSLRFDGTRGEMVLQLRAANLAQLDALVGQLSNSEFKADLLAANELEEGVSGRIRLR